MPGKGKPCDVVGVVRSDSCRCAIYGWARSACPKAYPGSAQVGALDLLKSPGVDAGERSDNDRGVGSGSEDLRNTSTHPNICESRLVAGVTHLHYQKEVAIVNKSEWAHQLGAIILGSFLRCDACTVVPKPISRFVFALAASTVA